MPFHKIVAFLLMVSACLQTFAAKIDKIETGPEILSDFYGHRRFIKICLEHVPISAGVLYKSKLVLAPRHSFIDYPLNEVPNHYTCLLSVSGSEWEEVSIDAIHTSDYHHDLIIITLQEERYTQQAIPVLRSYNQDQQVYITVETPEMLRTCTAYGMPKREKEIYLSLKDPSTTLEYGDSGSPVFQEQGLIGIIIQYLFHKKIAKAILFHENLEP